MESLQKPILAGAIMAAVDKFRGKDLFSMGTLKKSGLMAGSVFLVDTFAAAPDFDFSSFSNLPGSLLKPAEVGGVFALGNMLMGKDKLAGNFITGGVVEVVSDYVNNNLLPMMDLGISVKGSDMGNDSKALRSLDDLEDTDEDY